MIDQYLEICDNDHEVRLLKFVLEEVELVLRSKHIRRYSYLVKLLMMSYIPHATSPRAYKRLLEEELLVLPSVKTLRKITVQLDRKNRLDDAQCLRMRYPQLNAFDRNVILMIVEIYDHCHSARKKIRFYSEAILQSKLSDSKQKKSAPSFTCI